MYSHKNYQLVISTPVSSIKLPPEVTLHKVTQSMAGCRDGVAYAPSGKKRSKHTAGLFLSVRLGSTVQRKGKKWQRLSWPGEIDIPKLFFHFCSMESVIIHQGLDVGGLTADGLGCVLQYTQVAVDLVPPFQTRDNTRCCISVDQI